MHRERPRGVFVATAATVIEILSPGDETLAKLDFYARRAVDEVLVADPALRVIRVWQLRMGPAGSDAHYDETGRSGLLGVSGAELAAELTWP